MWLVDLFRRLIVLYLKFIVSVAFLLVLSSMLRGWWATLHLSFPSRLAVLLFCALVTMAAYFIRERRRARPPRQRPSGAERTPMLPPSGGAQW